MILFLLKCGKVDIFQCNLATLVDVLPILVVEDIGILDGDVMNHSFGTMGYDTILATSYIDVADMNVLEVRNIFLLDRGSLFLGSYMVVEVSCLESDGIARDVRHVDMVDEDILGSATSLHCTLESQASVGALESVVAYHDILHATRKLATNHKTAMGVIYRIVLDIDVLVHQP